MSTTKQDYYSLLGLDKGASSAEIKSAYRKMAMKHHPDRNQGNKHAEEKFKAIQHAYEVLSDPQKKQIYDAYGHEGVDAANGYGGSGANYHAQQGNFEDIFGSIFTDLFGGREFNRGSANTGTRKGADLRYFADLSLEEAVRGTNITIKIKVPLACNTCKGSGIKEGAKPATCRTCNGQGQVRMQQGFFSIQQTCPDCGGQGSMIRDYCKSCEGKGRVEEHKSLVVKIPAGVDNGDKIRLQGEGEAGIRGGKSGDLYVQVRIKEHQLFTREHSNLYCKVPISFATATLGGEVEVPTFTGLVKLKIPNETQSGRVFKLKGKGVTTVRKEGPGDLFCEVYVETPVNLNKQQRDLLKAFEDSLKSSNDKHNPNHGTWYNMIHSLFK